MNTYMEGVFVTLKVVDFCEHDVGHVVIKLVLDFFVKSLQDLDHIRARRLVVNHRAPNIVILRKELLVNKILANIILSILIINQLLERAEIDVLVATALFIFRLKELHEGFLDNFFVFPFCVFCGVHCFKVDA